MEPPIQTEYLRSGGATTLIFMVDGASAVSSLVMRSPMPGNMVDVVQRDEATPITTPSPRPAIYKDCAKKKTNAQTTYRRLLRANNRSSAVVGAAS